MIGSQLVKSIEIPSIPSKFPKISPKPINSLQQSSKIPLHPSKFSKKNISTSNLHVFFLKSLEILAKSINFVQVLP